MSWQQTVVRIAFSLAIGSCIGVQRELTGHPAGTKTHALVCLGSTVLALIQLQLAKDNPGMDTSRILAQIVSGIGFIGAGCILKDSNRKTGISGITTAATLWVVSCLGIGAGLGYYLITSVSFAAVLIVIVFGGMINKLIIKLKK